MVQQQQLQAGPMLVSVCVLQSGGLLLFAPLPSHPAALVQALLTYSLLTPSLVVRLWMQV